MGGVLTILSFVFIKETLYTPNAKQLPPPTNMKERLQRLKFNPVSFFFFFSCINLTHWLKKKLIFF